VFSSLTISYVHIDEVEEEEAREGEDEEEGALVRG
jgi:hypothetical protein